MDSFISPSLILLSLILNFDHQHLLYTAAPLGRLGAGRGKGGRLSTVYRLGVYLYFVTADSISTAIPGTRKLRTAVHTSK